MERPNAPHSGEEKLHLALITMEYPPFFGGGIGTYACHLARLLGAAGHRVSVFTLPREGKAPELPNVTVHHLPEETLATTGLGELDWLAENLRRGKWVSEQLANLHSAQPIDVIEVTDYFMDGLSLDTLSLTRRDGQPVPLITHFHGPYSLVTNLDGFSHPLFNQVEELILTGSPFRKTYSRQMRDQVNQLWPGADCQFVPAPFYYPDLDQDLHEKTSGSRFDFDFLYFGRLERRKGVTEFAEALKILAQSGLTPRVAFIGRDLPITPGSGSMGEWLERELRPLFGSKLHLLDELPQQKLWARLPRARVLVMPSLWESLGFAILEAACSGRPVFLSQEAGVSYILTESLKRRSLVDVRDFPTFAAKLRAIFDMPEPELLSWGLELRQAVKREFAPDQVLKHTLAYYQSCIKAAATTKLGTVTTHYREFLVSYFKKTIDLAQARQNDLTQLWEENQKIWGEYQKSLEEYQKIWGEYQKSLEENQKIWEETQTWSHKYLESQHDLQLAHTHLLALTSSRGWRLYQRLRYSPLGRLAGHVSKLVGYPKNKLEDPSG